LSLKPLIRIGIQPQILDPDEMNADPQPWTKKKEYEKNSAVDLHRFEANADPNFHIDSDPAK
jgi:hypothetical protein